MAHEGVCWNKRETIMSLSKQNLSERVSKASELSKVSIEHLLEKLELLGIEDNDHAISLLESESAPEDVLKEGLKDLGLPVIILNAVIKILKHGDVSAEKEYVASPINEAIKEQEAIRSSKSLEEVFSNVMASNKPISQYSDEELVTKYATTGDGELEAELIKRAKGSRFIASPYKEGGVDEIDVPATLRLLKKARRGEVFPSEFVDESGKMFRIFSVQEFSPEGRVVEMSPLSPKTALFDGYCSATSINFSGITDDCRAFMRIVLDQTEAKGAGYQLSASDKRDLISVARSKGIGSLKVMYPDLAVVFDEMKSIDDLPRLKKLREPANRDHAAKAVQQHFNTKKQY